MYNTPLRPLNPFLHPRYTPWTSGEKKLAVLEDETCLRELIARASACDEGEIDKLHTEIVDMLWWFAIDPAQMARDVMQSNKWRSPLTVDQAAHVVAALGEAGYPVWGNGAPDFYYHTGPRLRGVERDKIIWGAAHHWARMAARDDHPVYVSFGDARGFLLRPVQYDMPGSVNPSQYAALTLGPVGHSSSTAYMRTKTRCMVLVKPERKRERERT